MELMKVQKHIYSRKANCQTKEHKHTTKEKKPLSIFTFYIFNLSS